MASQDGQQGRYNPGGVGDLLGIEQGGGRGSNVFDAYLSSSVHPEEYLPRANFKNPQELARLRRISANHNAIYEGYADVMHLMWLGVIGGGAIGGGNKKAVERMVTGDRGGGGLRRRPREISAQGMDREQVER